MQSFVYNLTCKAKNAVLHVKLGFLHVKLKESLSMQLIGLNHTHQLFLV